VHLLVVLEPPLPPAAEPMLPPDRRNCSGHQGETALLDQHRHRERADRTVLEGLELVEQVAAVVGEPDEQVAVEEPQPARQLPELVLYGVDAASLSVRAAWRRPTPLASSRKSGWLQWGLRSR